MEIAQQFSALCTPVRHCPYEALEGDGLAAWKELSLENGGIVVIENESALAAEINNVLWTCKVLLGEPEFLNSNVLHLQVIGNLPQNRLIHLHR